MSPDTSKILHKKKKQILENWINGQIANESLREELISNKEARTQSEELLDAVLQKIASSADGASQEDSALELLETISITRARNGYSPRETGVYIFSLKEAFLKTLNDEIRDARALYEESLSVSNELDNIAIITFEMFIKGREEVILRQTDEIAEISTPVIRVWDGILALPIIGTLDSSRTQIVMESLLSQIVETSSSIAILDISGVPAVDSLVAQHLIKTVSATRLMGAECIISGIRPEIAQTVVHLGIDLSSIVTKSSLASALSYAFSTLRLEVKKNTKESKI
ncbi:MAG TPA: STAS domain-containing protein [Puia sp.]|nr:STAS domain-containing protein [Puia sp.]